MEMVNAPRMGGAVALWKKKKKYIPLFTQAASIIGLFKIFGPKKKTISKSLLNVSVKK